MTKKELLNTANQELEVLETDKKNLATNNNILVNDKNSSLKELDSFNKAGAIRRIVMRNKIDIQNDIERNEQRIEENKEKETTLPNSIKSKKEEIKNIKSDISLIGKELEKEDRANEKRDFKN